MGLMDYYENDIFSQPLNTITDTDDITEQKKKKLFEKLKQKSSRLNINREKYSDLDTTGRVFKHNKWVNTSGVQDFTNQNIAFGDLFREETVDYGKDILPRDIARSDTPDMILDPNKLYEPEHTYDENGISTGYTYKEVPQVKYATKNAYIRNLEPIDGRDVIKFGLANDNLTDEAKAINPSAEYWRYKDKTHFNPYKNYVYKENGKIVYNPDGTQKLGYSTEHGDLARSKGPALMDVKFKYQPVVEFELNRYMDRDVINARVQGTGNGPEVKKRYAGLGGGGSEYVYADMDPLMTGEHKGLPVKPGTGTPTVPYGYTKEGVYTLNSGSTKQQPLKTDTQLLQEARDSIYGKDYEPSAWENIVDAPGEFASGATEGVMSLIDGVGKLGAKGINAAFDTNYSGELFGEKNIKDTSDYISESLGVDKYDKEVRQKKSEKLVDSALNKFDIWHPIDTFDEIDWGNATHASIEFLKDPSMAAHSIGYMGGGAGGYGAAGKALVKGILKASSKTMAEKIAAKAATKNLSKSATDKLSKRYYEATSARLEKLTGSRYSMQLGYAFAQTNDLDNQYAKNNDGKHMDLVLYLGTLVGSATMAFPEAAAMKFGLIKAGEKALINPTIKSKIIGATGDLLKAYGYETAQETAEQIFQEAVTKFGTEKYKDKTFGEIMSESTQKIMGAGMMAGPSGVHTASAGITKNIAKSGLGIDLGDTVNGVKNTISKNKEKNNDWKISSQASSISDLQKKKNNIQQELNYAIEYANTIGKNLSEEEMGKVNENIKQLQTQLAKAENREKVYIDTVDDIESKGKEISEYLKLDGDITKEGKKDYINFISTFVQSVINDEVAIGNTDKIYDAWKINKDVVSKDEFRNIVKMNTDSRIYQKMSNPQYTEDAIKNSDIGGLENIIKSEEFNKMVDQGQIKIDNELMSKLDEIGIAGTKLAHSVALNVAENDKIEPAEKVEMIQKVLTDKISSDVLNEVKKRKIAARMSGEYQKAEGTDGVSSDIANTILEVIAGKKDKERLNGISEGLEKKQNLDKTIYETGKEVYKSDIDYYRNNDIPIKEKANRYSQEVNRILSERGVSKLVEEIHGNKTVNNYQMPTFIDIAKTINADIDNISVVPRYNPKDGEKQGREIGFYKTYLARKNDIDILRYTDAKLDGKEWESTDNIQNNNDTEPPSDTNDYGPETNIDFDFDNEIENNGEGNEGEGSNGTTIIPPTQNTHKMIDNTEYAKGENSKLIYAESGTGKSTYAKENQDKTIDFDRFLMQEMKNDAKELANRNDAVGKQAQLVLNEIKDYVESNADGQKRIKVMKAFTSLLSLNGEVNNGEDAYNAFHKRYSTNKLKKALSENGKEVLVGGSEIDYSQINGGKIDKAYFNDKSVYKQRDKGLKNIEKEAKNEASNKSELKQKYINRANKISKNRDSMKKLLTGEAVVLNENEYIGSKKSTHNGGEQITQNTTTEDISEPQVPSIEKPSESQTVKTKDTSEPQTATVKKINEQVRIFKQAEMFLDEKADRLAELDDELSELQDKMAKGEYEEGEDKKYDIEKENGEKIEASILEIHEASEELDRMIKGSKKIFKVKRLSGSIRKGFIEAYRIYTENKQKDDVNGYKNAKSFIGKMRSIIESIIEAFKNIKKIINEDLQTNNELINKLLGEQEIDKGIIIDILRTVKKNSNGYTKLVKLTKDAQKRGRSKVNNIMNRRQAMVSLNRQLRDIKDQYKWNDNYVAREMEAIDEEMQRMREEIYNGDKVKMLFADKYLDIGEGKNIFNSISVQNNMSQFIEVKGNKFNSMSYKDLLDTIEC